MISVTKILGLFFFIWSVDIPEKTGEERNNVYIHQVYV